ncbi:fluoride efflux transporter CrcB [Pseudonocardia tropica]|uniref:Fluoride-specific ion channel FluC n=1 Tax=Pseudonocardia tropica TaxID=681289 RepID=A0ABV1K2E7_9PSEU
MVSEQPVADGADGACPVEQAGPPVTTPSSRRWPVLAAVATGGVVGAEARFVIGVAFPQPSGGWPWTTFLVNVSGCLLIGVLLTVLSELTVPHPLLRPLLGVGVLGGYTTFSTYAVDVVALVDAGRPVVALGYVVATPLAAVAACVLGVAVTRRAAGRTGGEPE